MSSKSLIVPLVLAITLRVLCMQATSQATIDDDAGGKLVLVNITDVMPPTSFISMKIQVGDGDFAPPISLRGGQEYQLKASKNKTYKAVTFFGPEYSVFYPYVPTRDKGQAAVYWKIDDEGFSKSYDGSSWEFNSAWAVGGKERSDLL